MTGVESLMDVRGNLEWRYAVSWTNKLAKYKRLGYVNKTEVFHGFQAWNSYYANYFEKPPGTVVHNVCSY